jgi:hypothetical protein
MEVLRAIVEEDYTLRAGPVADALSEALKDEEQGAQLHAGAAAMLGWMAGVDDCWQAVPSGTRIVASEALEVALLDRAAEVRLQAALAFPIVAAKSDDIEKRSDAAYALAAALDVEGSVHQDEGTRLALIDALQSMLYKGIWQEAWTLSLHVIVDELEREGLDADIGEVAHAALVEWLTEPGICDDDYWDDVDAWRKCIDQGVGRYEEG